ncbi:Aste57867_15622 [Aphanomyces stellatus]|uniref:Aste57867_15622 protein n=1 Tax=Aphanomyces stellatus TaxID=120398 RepID=A0A485L3I6_9STRA|nr:hypothetical protein As57867_015566 [Aphanomyces stellatus]VFT92420.1 Aste57867_15622 [Aphanomyces stellatus]
MMEPNTKYALHHAEKPTSLKWAATIKLTPEVLAKLQENPSAISVRFAADKSETSVLQVDGASYELFSHAEEKTVNHLCALVRADDGDGYAFHETGRIAKKLIVQRMLDVQEKDRLKDRHAKSVQESKSRASIVVDAIKPAGRATRKRQIVLLETFPSIAASTPAKPRLAFSLAWFVQTILRRLKSGLTAEGVASIQRMIEKEELRLAIDAAKTEAATKKKEAMAIAAVAKVSSPSTKGGKRVAKPKQTKAAKALALPAATTSTLQHEKGRDDKVEIGCKKAKNGQTDEEEPSPWTNVGRPNKADAPDDAHPSQQEGQVSGDDKQAHAAHPAAAGPTHIRAKRRVRSAALNTLSTFTPDIEALFKKHAAMRAVPRATSDADVAACQQLHADAMTDWKILEKAYLVENILHRTKSITGYYTNPKYDKTASQREEGMGLMKNMLDQLQGHMTQLDCAIATFQSKQDDQAPVG